MPADGEVEMGAGGASGATAEAHYLSALYLVSFFYFEFGEVEVEGEESLAVVDDDAVAFKVQETCEKYRA